MNKKSKKIYESSLSESNEHVSRSDSEDVAETSEDYYQSECYTETIDDDSQSKCDTEMSESASQPEYRTETSEDTNQSECETETSEDASQNFDDDENIFLEKKRKHILVESKKQQLQKVVKIDMKKDGKDIREICFRDINEHYSLGKYNKFTVTIMKKNGYINATKLCQEIGRELGSTKELKKWFQNKNSKKIVKSVSSYTCIDIKNLSFIINSGGNETRGTYVHNLLITHIASWASPEFAVEISQIVNEYFSTKEREKNDSLLRGKNDRIIKLSSDMNELLKINKEQDKKMEKGNIKLNKLLKLNKKQDKELCELRIIADHSRQNVDILVDELDVKCRHVVVRTENQKDDNILIIMKKNEQPKRKTEYVYYDYYVARTNKENRNIAIVKQQKIFKKLTIVMEIKYVPNSIVLWKNIRNEIANRKNKKIIANGNDFNLSGDYTEQKLIKDIKNIFDKRLNHIMVD